MKIEAARYATGWARNMILSIEPDAKAYAIYHRYQTPNIDRYPALRNRDSELIPAVVGLAVAEGGDGTVKSITFTGAELAKQFGYEPVGAQYVQTFTVVVSR